MSHKADRGANGSNGGKWIRPEKRWRIYDRDGWRCVWCQAPVGTTISGVWTCNARRVPPGTTPRGATLDHVVPRHVGLRPDNDERNLVTACLECNSDRGCGSAGPWPGASRASGAGRTPRWTGCSKPPTSPYRRPCQAGEQKPLRKIPPCVNPQLRSETNTRGRRFEWFRSMRPRRTGRR